MSKDVLRLAFKKIRDQLPQERRKHASLNCFRQLLPVISSFEYVLSFVSFGSEIDLSLLNLYLGRTNRLLLPKIDDPMMQVFQVSDPHTQLIQNSLGLYEPNPATCTQVNASLIQLILVPALSFDQKNHRLGYGKGYYDRFLKKLPAIQSIGVGFQEQLTSSLPTIATDIPLTKVSLF